MNIDQFKFILQTFADPGASFLSEKSQIICSVNGDLIEISVSSKMGNVIVNDGGRDQDAATWIVDRLAKLNLLANRLISDQFNNKLFVPPSGNLLSSLEVSPDEAVIKAENALDIAIETLDSVSPLETTVLYVTSDAGEGKTSLINQLTYVQAKRYIEKKSHFLIVPIPLGGRHFLRFDDITVGALQNRYRFPFLYYNSFVELVKMGVIVPAYDGFEEMFVESSSGEALSAMGLLLGSLDSKGAFILAARKAYFEFENLKNLERSYDTIKDYSVGFGKLELCRWEKKQFIIYCKKRNIDDSEKIYEKVSERLGENHSLLTRPVLVRRLVDLVSESEDLDQFLNQINAAGPDFFSVFVLNIIEREANEKWIDTFNEVGIPLLLVEEHCELLRDIALAMWESHVDFIKNDYLDFIADYFCQTHNKNSTQTRQVRERLRGHALLVLSPNSVLSVEFDHEEFKLFFLGEGIARQILILNENAKLETLTIFRKGRLPQNSQFALIRFLKRQKDFNPHSVIKFLLAVSAFDGQATYTQENCTSIIAQLLSGMEGEGIVINNLVFGVDVLRDKSFKDVIFSNCFFNSTSLESSIFTNCKFIECRFGQLRFYKSSRFKDVFFKECSIESFKDVEKNQEIWSPSIIDKKLKELGFEVTWKIQEQLNEDKVQKNSDQELVEIEKLLRYFLRSTQIREGVIFMKMGNRGQIFIDEVIPELLACEALVEVVNTGGGDQRRFKLGIPLSNLNDIFSHSDGSFSKFLSLCTEFSQS